ncbi:hypothetical protein NC651_031853 [Populus alba x Populus x berolinensis]|nr:hypothetical protein NC651_031853 [Populus alba x Populus x berolinensis]
MVRTWEFPNSCDGNRNPWASAGSKKGGRLCNLSGRLASTMRHCTSSHRSGSVLRPITRLKDVIVGGNRRGSFIRGSSTSDN